MPIHPHMENVTLDIGFRASAEPQTLDLRVTTGGVAELPLAPWAVGSMIECINRGLAGGAEFPPWSGSAELEAGPTGEGAKAGGELGPSYSFRLRVAGVSPYFVRTIVESFAACARPHACLGVTVVGSLPLDGSSMSVRSPQVAEWLEDAAAYPQAWGRPGFRAIDESAARGAAVRVTLKSARVDDVAIDLERSIEAWLTAILTMPNLARTTRGRAAPQAVFARSRSELMARLELFDHAPGPARAALLNALGWVNAQVTPIAEARIALP
jgi:hypothetical protein